MCPDGGLQSAPARRVETSQERSSGISPSKSRIRNPPMPQAVHWKAQSLASRHPHALYQRIPMRLVVHSRWTSPLEERPTVSGSLHLRGSSSGVATNPQRSSMLSTLLWYLTLLLVWLRNADASILFLTCTGAREDSASESIRVAEFPRALTLRFHSRLTKARVSIHSAAPHSTPSRAMSTLASLISGADCGPINPLQGLAKRFDADRGASQVRRIDKRVLPETAEC